MSFNDYHTHTTFSDGRDSMSTMCREAVSLGMEEIAFTEHAEWVNGRTGFFSHPPDYFHVLERNQDHFAPHGLRVLSGVEIGNPHEHEKDASLLLSSYQFDVVIGSMHWLYGENIHNINCFVNRDPIKVYQDYFRESAVMVRNFNFQILAHTDRIFLRGAQLGILPTAPQIETEVRDMLDALIETDTAFEINCRLLSARQHWNTLLLRMLMWYKEAGGNKIVINSDAHQTKHLPMNRDVAADLVHRAGLKDAVQTHLLSSP